MVLDLDMCFIDFYIEIKVYLQYYFIIAKSRLFEKDFKYFGSFDFSGWAYLYGEARSLGILWSQTDQQDGDLYLACGVDRFLQKEHRLYV